jgi:flagellar biosynthesis GTPase FlhF
VRGAAGDLRREMRAAASEARQGGAKGRGQKDGPLGDFADYTDKDSWRAAKEEMRRVKQEWKEQARRAKDESRRAREEAQRARRQAKEAQERARAQAQEELQRIGRRVQRQVQDHFTRGDWPTGVREGLTELVKEFGEFGKDFGKDFGFGRGDNGTGTSASRPEYTYPPEDFPAEYEPAWAHEESSGDAARDLDRLLDRFRDDIRDAARDHGVSDEQLRDARRHLSTAAAHIGVILRRPQV